eukprot:3526556-Prymnesium_polylepis.1
MAAGPLRVQPLLKTYLSLMARKSRVEAVECADYYGEGAADTTIFEELESRVQSLGHMMDAVKGAT